MAIARKLIVASLLTCACGDLASAQSNGENLRTDAAKAMKTAAAFYRTKVASYGGYVYYYEQDRWITTYAGERLVGQPKFATAFASFQAKSSVAI